MAQQIEQRHLDFLEQAKNAFEADGGLYTFRDGTHDGNDTMIALRYGMGRDCVLIYELDECVANFVQQITPAPVPRTSVMKFSHDMEKQLKVNDYKSGWSKEHWCDLASDLERHTEIMRKELMKTPEDRDKYEITIRCANIANFAMMIAENEDEPI